MKRDLIKECLPERDHFMAPAWIGLIRFASGQPEIVEAFEKESGMKFRIPCGIEGMIDKASGYQEDMLFKFAAWVTKNLWGDTSKPEHDKAGGEHE